MKKASFVTPNYLNNNIIFDSMSPLNRDNVFEKYVLLRKEFELKGYDLSTSDINPIVSSDIIVYLDMPKVMPANESVEKSFLLLHECEVIKPENFHLENHKFFKKIFTWDDSLVDNKKYFKINISNYSFQSTNVSRIPIDKKKLCILINNNKTYRHAFELYSHRIKAIRWFEKHHPESLDLFGQGWDNYMPPNSKVNKLINIFVRYKTRLIYSRNHLYKTYMGTLTSKYKTMQMYKFSICYENARGLRGYITEKIFDSFIANCIPIYWGADNISEHIPSECFIDKRKFSSHEKLYEYISNMNETTYSTFLHAIEDFLHSSDAKPFSVDYYCKKIVNECLKKI
tara:strand:+ start:83 stop:1108 length:1026 start_codon:yes stop_codon:yes gene_type:complete